ncbi:MAG: LysM peptidoglycan-binding domain-containing protein [Halanaerobiales bacterium]
MKNKISFYAIILIIILSFSSLILADQVHRVSSGDSLYLIAREYGVTIEEIINKNNLKNGSSIVPRQVLIIPEKSVYYVQAGDTLAQISEKIDVNMDDLIEVNKITNPGLIYPDQILKLPEQKKEQYIMKTSVKTYRIKSGDTLYSISQKFGVAINNLITLNNIQEPKNLTIGQKLNIPEYTFSELSTMYPTNFFHHGDTTSNKIALTFDDGPDTKYTPQILDVLNKHEVPATFFYLGKRIQKNPQVAIRTVQEGHVIANHSWSHPELTRLNDLKVYDEIKETEIAIAKSSGPQTGLIRPPYGLISQKIMEQLKNLNYRVIQWSVDSRDWQDQDVDQILINSIPDIQGGGIILFHSAGGKKQSFQATVDVLPELIYTLEVQGYEFVTVDELLDIPAYNN